MAVRIPAGQQDGYVTKLNTRIIGTFQTEQEALDAGSSAARADAADRALPWPVNLTILKAKGGVALTLHMLTVHPDGKVTKRGLRKGQWGRRSARKN